MKFTVDPKAFHATLRAALPAVPTRPTHPILANVRLTAVNGRVELTGFDLSLGVSAWVDATIDEDGVICLPAKLLESIVSRLPAGPIAFACEPDSSLVAISTLSGSYEIRGMSADEFPELGEVEGDDGLSFEASELNAALSSVLYSSATDETKQILCGVHFSRNDRDRVELAATDGHRLSVVRADHTSDADATFPKNGVTLPRAALLSVAKMVAALPADEVIEIHFDDARALFVTSIGSIFSRIVDGTFPAYGQLLPTDFSKEISVDRAALNAALGRIAVIADRKNNVVKLDIGAGRIAVTVDAADVGSGKEIVDCQEDGARLVVAFNVKYMLDTLGAIGSSEVLMKFNEPTSPVVVTPIGGMTSTHLIMPVQIRD